MGWDTSEKLEGTSHLTPFANPKPIDNITLNEKNQMSLSADSQGGIDSKHALA